MKRILAGLAVLGAVSVGFAGPAFADKPEQVEGVCGPLDSGKIDTTGDPLSVTIVAPEGMLITGYCVKAGSIKQGNGPEYLAVDPALPSITISHSSDKAVSHYSYSFEPVVPESPEPDPVVVTPVAPILTEPSCPDDPFGSVTMPPLPTGVKMHSGFPAYNEVESFWYGWLAADEGYLFPDGTMDHYFSVDVNPLNCEPFPEPHVPGAPITVDPPVTGLPTPVITPEVEPFPEFTPVVPEVHEDIWPVPQSAPAGLGTNVGVNIQSAAVAK